MVFECIIILFFVTGCLAMHVDVSPKYQLVLPDENVTFMCRVGVPIQYCRVEIPGKNNVFNLNTKALPTDGVRYSGKGLEEGQCGFTIESIKEINNGEVRCSLGFTTDTTESVATMRLVVAKPPSSPQLEIQKQYEQSWAYKVGDNLRAVCSVRDGRPVANLTWFLDDEPVSSHFLTPPTIITNKNDLETVYQNFTKELRPSDNGLSLKCVANHLALSGNNVASRLLNVTYSPLPQSNPIDKFGYVLGQDGVISVEIEANPKPHLQWHIRDQLIKEGGHDSTGRIKAEFIQDLGRGRYEASLIIADINKQDTEVQYILTAYNDQGSQEYIILISTSAEPADLEMGAPTIIGIVAAVLIVLLIVFMIIFARVTGRWCFSDTRRNDLRHTGESSDTESVDVRHTNKQPLKLTTLFKKKPKQNDDERPKSVETVESKIQDDHDKPSEKEGIVYAELDLLQPNLKRVLKNDDDRTEYAEIVYSQKDLNEKQAKEGDDDKNNKSAAAS